MKNKLESLPLIAERKKLYGQIIDLIRKKGSLDKKELGRLIGVSFPTISKIIGDLLRNGIIEIKEKGKSSGGRKPDIYSLNETAFLSIGVVIGSVDVQVILMNLKADVLESYTFTRVDGMSPSEVVQCIHKAVGSIYRNKKEAVQNILGIGIATAGPLDRKAGIILNQNVIPAELWEYVPICNMITQKIDLPLFLENKSRAGALAEQWFGIAKNTENLVFIHADYGIGAGIITNGRLIEGKIDVTGSLNYMIIEMTRMGEDTDFLGRLKEYSTIYAIVAETRKALKSGRKSMLRELINEDIEKLSFDHICRGVLEKDKLSLSVMRRAGCAFGIAISNFINLFWPEEVILGGTTIDKCPLFFDLATETARKYIYPPAFKENVDFKKSSFSEKVIAIGAATQVFNYYFTPDRY